MLELSINNIAPGNDKLYASVVGCYIFTGIALYYFSKVYLVVAHAADQFLIGNTHLGQSAQLTWFNYRELVTDNLNVAVNLAKAPIHFGGDVISKVKGYVVKQRLDRDPSDTDCLSFVSMFTL